MKSYALFQQYIWLVNTIHKYRKLTLVSALTGHVEGSRAFSRYRTIDIDMKKDLVKILEGAK